jgi:hypothetical protein
LTSGTATPYIAYRLYEKSWKVPPKDATLLRQATIELIEADPWFLATAMPYFLSSLETKDLVRLTPFVGAGQSHSAAGMLRAILWYHGHKGAYRPDRSGRDQLRRAFAYLKQVSPKQRDRTWHEMLVGCYRVLDYDKYKRAVPSLLELTPPEWRSAPLIQFLNALGAKKDWTTYDKFRGEWDQLPPGHHACECYLNDLYTNDGLRAVAAGKWAGVPEALSKAAAVRGCPHLNTGGLRLDLVQILIAKRKLLGSVREYLERAAGFKARPEDVTKLQRKLEDAT